MKAITIRNEKEIVRELAQILLAFDMECCRYQRDVYLYLDENSDGRLTIFTNVGGNSWLDDDHITIYRDKEHLEDFLDWYQNLQEIADTLCIDTDQLRHIIRTDMHLEDYDIEDIGYPDAYQWIRSGECDDQIEEILRHSYYDMLRDNFSDYAEKAMDIIFEATHDYLDGMHEEDDHNEMQ